VNVVDSSAWLEYFAAGPNAGHFAVAIEDAGSLLLPSVVLFEVFKRVLVQRGPDEALKSAAFMQRGEVVPLDASISLSAARLSLDMQLPMADSIILATARRHRAVLWTQDADFRGLDGVRFFERRA